MLFIAGLVVGYVVALVTLYFRDMPATLKQKGGQ